MKYDLARGFEPYGCNIGQKGFAHGPEAHTTTMWRKTFVTVLVWISAGKTSLPACTQRRARLITCASGLPSISSSYAVMAGLSEDVCRALFLRSILPAQGCASIACQAWPAESWYRLPIDSQTYCCKRTPSRPAVVKHIPNQSTTV